MRYGIRDLNRVETNPLGQAIVRRVNIKVPLEANKSTYAIEENSPLERNFPLGLWVTKPGTKVNQNKTQVAGAIFDSAYIILRNQETNILTKLPFEQVRLANEQGLPFRFNFPGPINLSESEIEVPDNATIPAGTVLEMQFEYIKAKK